LKKGAYVPIYKTSVNEEIGMTQKTTKDWQAVRDEEVSELESTEITPEEHTSEQGILNHPSYLELLDKLTLSEQQAHENWEKSVRSLAELENVRRRAERDVEHAHRYGVEKLIKEIIPVLDSMEQALQAAVQAENQSMIEGIELTHKLLLSALSKFQVMQIDAMGQPFNPNCHEAMAMLESEDAPANTIINVFQQGYQLGERVLRPARVVVAKAKNT
jgi:molecular chaperone GrpE